MRVFTEDINKLFEQATELFEREEKIHLNSTNNAIFFKKFTAFLNEKTKSNLKFDTIYKQYYIRLKNYPLPEIGFSLNYLNALSRLVNNTDYIQNFSMVLESENEIPEFPYPPYLPCFPATPAVRINIPEFRDVWVKDESFNPSGTHKDRMSWEIYLFYNEFIKEQLDSGSKVSIPSLSIISSGNAALAIQYLLRLNGLPNLKVILDKHIDKTLLEVIKKSGCEVYLVDLDTILSSEDILNITNNKKGYDITYGERIENIKLSYYDWLSYEVLNLNPQNLFIPYGTGDLYRNLVEICINEIKSTRTSKRFFGNKNILSKCNFYGACTNNKKSKMKMLYASHNSFKQNDLKNIFESGQIGSQSKLIEVKERYVDEALILADKNGISCEPSGAAGIALFLQMKEKLNPDSKHVIINTGKMKYDLF